MPLKFMKPIRAEYLSQTIKPGMGENQYGTPFTIDEAESVTSRNLSSRAFPAMQVRPGRSVAFSGLLPVNGIGARDNAYAHGAKSTSWVYWDGTQVGTVKSGLSNARTNFVDFTTGTAKYTIMSNGTDRYYWDGESGNYWLQKADNSSGGATIYGIVELNGKLYGVDGYGGRLLEWNGTDAWVQVAPSYTGSALVRSVVVFNGKIYGGDYQAGKLLEWNGTNAWVVKADTFGTETRILSLAVFNNKLYASTSPNGKLLEWNGTNAWAEKAGSYSSLGVYAITVFNNKLYGAETLGALLEWNNVDAWVKVANPHFSAARPATMAVFNNKLYGAGVNTGTLLEWNDVDAWVEKAPKFGEQSNIYSLYVFDNKLYASTGNATTDGRLLVWNGTDAWTEESAPYIGEYTLYSLTTFNGKLYAGTYPKGKLLEWTGPSSAVSLTAAPLTRLIATHRGRLYALIGRELKFSALNLITDWTTVNDAGSITITNAKSDGVAIIEYADHIVVLTGNSMHELHGSGPQNYQLIDISDDGCIAERTLIENAGVLYWLDEGEFKAYTGSKPVVISQKVQSYLKEIPSAYKYKACCGKLGKYIYLSIPYGSSATENNLLLEYDTELRQWYPQTGAFVDFVTIGEKLYGVDSSGIVYDMDNGTTDAGVAITWYKETGAYLKQSLRNKKMLQNLYIAFDQPVGSTFTVGTSVTVDASDFVTRTTFTAGSAEQNVKTVIDANQIGYVDWYRLKLAGTGPLTVHAIEQVFRMER